MNEDRRPRRPQMDGLRALCFLAVFGLHVGQGTATWRPFAWGYAAVYVFFALSGFLIAGILGRVDLRTPGGLAAYYARRAARILPAYLMGLALAACLWDFPEYPWYLAFLSNLKMLRDGEPVSAPVGHFWTLAVEWQFYLAFPLAFLACPARWRAALVLAALAACKVARPLAYARHGAGAIGATAVASEYLLWGCLLALAPRPSGRTAAACLAVGVAMFAGWTGWRAGVGTLGYSDSPWFTILGGTPDGLGSALMVYGLWWSEGVASRALSWRPLVYLGTISYGLYIYHGPALAVASRLRRDVPGAWRVYWEIGLLLTLAMAIPSWHLVERPVARMGLRGRGRRGNAPARVIEPSMGRD